jgi:hypothetical protein
LSQKENNILKFVNITNHKTKPELLLETNSFLLQVHELQEEKPEYEFYGFKSFSSQSYFLFLEKETSITKFLLYTLSQPQ